MNTAREPGTVPTVSTDSTQSRPQEPGDSRGLAVLLGLSNRGKHVYAGTVPAETVARRRAANKVARKSRRANRRTR